MTEHPPRTPEPPSPSVDPVPPAETIRPGLGCPACTGLLLGIPLAILLLWLQVPNFVQLVTVVILLVIASLAWQVRALSVAVRVAIVSVLLAVACYVGLIVVLGI